MFLDGQARDGCLWNCQSQAFVLCLASSELEAKFITLCLPVSSLIPTVDLTSSKFDELISCLHSLRWVWWRQFHLFNLRNLALKGTGLFLLFWRQCLRLFAGHGPLSLTLLRLSDIIFLTATAHVVSFFLIAIFEAGLFSHYRFVTQTFNFVSTSIGILTIWVFIWYTLCLAFSIRVAASS